MTKVKIVCGPLPAMLGLVVLGVGSRAAGQDVADGDVIHGRVTTDNGAIYEGRLRFGGDEEAAWGNYFNGVKDGNPWADYVPREQLIEVVPVEIFGVGIGSRERQIGLGRPFMARFGDIARIDASGRDLRVALKTGTVFELDRFSADDYADGVRIWDAGRGVVDLDEWQIQSIELLSAPSPEAAPELLHGTVRTRHGDFTGFVQWNRKQCVVSDVLGGDTADGELGLPFLAIRSIARRSSDSALVTLDDGREIVLSDTREIGPGSHGIYIDDERYGRVLISWDVFERLDFSPGGVGPAYDDFPAGFPITGRVLTRSGRQLAGRLVYDLDESETTETLDAPWQGVDYTILFGLVASIELPGLEDVGLPHARVSLHGGQELELERSGDLGEENAGLLIFADGRQDPEYVRWADVAQIDFDRPPASR